MDIKIGKPIWYGDGLKNGFRKAKELGFDYLEVVLDYPWYPSQEVNKLLMKLKRNYKLPLAFHFPILELNLCHPSDEISTPSLKTCMKFLSSIRTLDPIYVNLHLTALLFTQKFKEIWKEVIKKAEERAIQLHEFSKSHKIFLTFENGVEEDLKIDDLLFLLKKDLNLCLDLGHAIITTYRENQKLDCVKLLRGWINKFKEIIRVIHWHDVAMVGNEIKCHLTLGSGEMSLEKVADLIRKTNCEYILLECFDSLKGKKIVPAKVTDWKRSLKVCKKFLLDRV